MTFKAKYIQEIYLEEINCELPYFNISKCAFIARFFYINYISKQYLDNNVAIIAYIDIIKMKFKGDIQL